MKVFSVSELTFAIKSLLEPNFRSISVQGEISNFKLQSSGHLYFSLKDQNSQLSAALFKGSAAKLPRMPKEGDQVIASGEISLYAPRGSYQIIVKELQFLGVGELLLKLHQLKETLKNRGWFEPSLKKPLPKFPKKIGVVTSPTGAVIQDIIHVLKRRFSGFHVILSPVKVQGEGAALEIAQAIKAFNQYDLIDVMIVGRGGGSIEDLWAFNEEVVAEAIFASKIPVISAVGHETDTTIADLVADVRAPTPSAAAELAVSEKANLIQYLENAKLICRERVLTQIRWIKQQLSAYRKHPLISTPYGVLAPLIQRLDELSRRLELLNPLIKIRQYKERLQSIRRHLESLNPNNILKKGYCVLFSEKDDSIILSAQNVKPEDAFRAKLHDGEIIMNAKKVKINESRTSLI